MRQWDQASEDRRCRCGRRGAAGWRAGARRRGRLRLAQADGSFAEEFVARDDLAQALTDDERPAHPRALRLVAPVARPRRGLVEEDRDAALWRLKWAVSLIEDLPEVGRDASWRRSTTSSRCSAATATTCGPCTRPAPGSRRPSATTRRLDRELAAWLAEPRDSRSDCQACELREQARLVVAQTRAGLWSSWPRWSPASSPAATSPSCACRSTPSCGSTAATSTERSRRSGGRGTWPRATRGPRPRWRPACACSCGWATSTAPSTSSSPGCRGSTTLPTPRQRMWFAATAAFVLDQAAAVGLAPDAVDGRPVERRRGRAAPHRDRDRRGLRRALRLDRHLHDAGGRARPRSGVRASRPAADPAAVAAAGAVPADEAVPPSTGALERAGVVRDGLRAAGADLEDRDQGVAARPRRPPAGGHARAVGGRLAARPHVRAGLRRPRAAPRPARRGLEAATSRRRAWLSPAPRARSPCSTLSRPLD